MAYAVTAPGMLRPKDVAKRLGVCRSRVYKMIQAGEMGSVQVGGVIRIPEAEVDRYIAENWTPAKEKIV